ncbi:MAG: hypothetical protein ACLQU1_24105 [Bryobacteraceae bacterium]
MKPARLLDVGGPVEHQRNLGPLDLVPLNRFGDQEALAVRGDPKNVADLHANVELEKGLGNTRFKAAGIPEPFLDLFGPPLPKLRIDGDLAPLPSPAPRRAPSPPYIALLYAVLRRAPSPRYIVQS